MRVVNMALARRHVHTRLHRSLACACTSSGITDKPHRTTGDPATKEAFLSLGLRELDKEFLQESRVRVRQHVNPLKKSLQIKHGPLQWNEIFNNPQAPLVVDVGCGYGRFALQLSQTYPTLNCIGLEIREPTVDRANRWAQALNLQDRMAFVVANATISMNSMLQSYPGSIVLVSIQYPDPHFKRKHQKRHTVQPQFCSEVADVLCPGGLVFVQSDVRTVVDYIYDCFQDAEPQRLQETGDVEDIDLTDPEQLVRPRIPKPDSLPQDDNISTLTDGFQPLKFNPLGIPTEREIHSQERGKGVYRFMLQKQ